MATIFESSAHSVHLMYSLLCSFVVLDVSHSGFESGYLVLIVPVPGNCIYIMVCCPHTNV